MAKDKLPSEEKAALELVGKTIEAVKVNLDYAKDVCNLGIIFADGTRLDIGSTINGCWGDDCQADSALLVDLLAKPKATRKPKSKG